MEDNKRHANCEREDKAAGNLIERRIDIFEGIIAEAADDVSSIGKRAIGGRT